MRFEDIKGLGVKRIRKLYDAGLSSPSDLLTIFPSVYVMPGTGISDFEEGSVALFAQCETEPILKFVRKGLSILKATFFDGKDRFVCVWFNRPFVKKQLCVGKFYAITGSLKRTGSKAEVGVALFASADSTNEILTIYRPYNGVPSKILKEAIIQVLQNVTVQGQIPAEFCEKFNVLPLNICIKTLHMPKNKQELIIAKDSAALQMLAFDIAVFLQIKGEKSQNKANKYAENYEKLRKVIKSLPFELTEDQARAVDTIIADLHSERRMNRLLEGDVGCGKTIVAFLAMYYAAMSGYQAALMAPTEILARQHYLKAVHFFGALGVRCELLCGSQSKERRAEALFNIESGNAQIVIGTHSIFQDTVKFKNLALTIADEQQRFGVEQRGSLENKGIFTDSLVMSATPIPRTLALTLYGDLDITQIKSLPQNKAKILTRYVPEYKQKDMFEYIYRRSFEGESSYVVCPRVDDEEKMSVAGVYADLHKRYGDIVGMVHGQMNETDKNKIMEDFASGKIKILVCTTVIEVGIDVPAAVNMIILDAESYGLSQLHQLRGRVGRGGKESFCFVTSKGKQSDRLDYFIRTDNGFELAEYDFKTRGAGDFLGKRQHGSDNIFADISVNEELLGRAKSMAQQLVSSGLISCRNRDFEFIKGLTLN